MNNDSLTPQLLEVSQLLASGMTYLQISQAMNVPRSTIGRWAKLPTVQTQIETLRNQALESHLEVNRDLATQSAESLKEKLLQSARRQEQLLGEGYEISNELFVLTRKMLGRAAEILTGDKVIESHEKILISSLPTYLKAATDMLRSVSDVEDKHFALEELSQRMNEWEAHWANQSDRN